MTFRLAASVLAIAVSLAACSREDQGATTPAAPSATAEAPAPEPEIAIDRTDKFTYANYGEVAVRHLHLDLDVKFDERVLEGTATLDIERLQPDANRLVLDTNDLTIASVEAGTGESFLPAVFTLGEDDAALGAALEVSLPPDADRVRIAYRTSPDAAGLQWLAPEQTAGKAHPFMFSQNQTINARSMAPVQDTPAVRMTYTATLRTPPELIAVMSAEQDQGPRDGEYSFSMPQPIPAYLLAIAAGDMEFRAISDTIGVYAESYIVEAAAKEFEDTPAMEASTEALYGPYLWGRYDMIVLPPSFPFGGMENPRLSFLTPTLVAGDKSLTNVVAHELAHSWSGNLVTNATWRDSWLNEGFTSYVENRIMEAVFGAERAEMERALAMEDLKRAVAEAARPELTNLKLPADLQHPDEAFSQVAYVKGQFFLHFLEERYGRDAFDAFLKDYFSQFAFKAIVTEEFLAYLEEKLLSAAPEAASAAEIDAWISGPGIPETAAEPVSAAFSRVTADQLAWLGGDIAAADIQTGAWTTHEWLHFLNTLPDSLTLDQYAALDSAFGLSASTNAEIANAWYLKAIAGGYEPAMASLEAFLKSVGRGKFIYRLYTDLEASGRGDFARRIYAEARPGYHPIAQKRIDEILQ